MNKSIVWYIGVWFLCTRIICEYELSIDVFCSINSRPLKSTHLRDIARKQCPADFFNK